MLLDAYGFRLCAANLPGDSWRSQHDTLKWRLYEDARAVGLHARVEVFGLFAALLPQAASEEISSWSGHKRQGLVPVPDFVAPCRLDSEGPVRDILFELKTLHHSAATYPANPERCHAVARRASGLNTEYLRKARSLDQRFLGVSADCQGPVELRVRSYGTIRGLVFGTWGEASPDVDLFMNQVADAGGRQADQPDADAVREALIWRLRRRWGLTTLRANARLLLDRLALVGRGAAIAADRRRDARRMHSMELHSSLEWSRRGPRLWRARRPHTWL